MGNDIEIRVRVANNTATGLAAVNRSLNQLRDEARDAGRGLDSLAARAAAASLALRGLRDAAQDASRSLRSLNTTARTTDNRLTGLSDRSRTLRRDTDDLDGSMRRLGTTLGGLRGNTGTIRTSMGNAGDGMSKLRAAAIALSPALIPVAAATVPIIANAGAAGIALGAFGAAVIGQLSAVKDAADAQKKYSDAVKKHGPASQQAAQAEAAYLEQVQHMDPATRRAAAALSVLKDQYQGWSKSLAGDTMPVVTKGLAVFGGLLPRLTPVVKGAASQLDRFMTILGGGINSSGFAAFTDSFSKFATGALSRANDGLVRFMRTLSSGAGSSQFTEFMAYVRQVGPQVGETLGNLARALVHVIAAASETGVGLLTVVNAFAKLVNALPSGLLSSLLQFALVMKTVRLAAAGLGGAGGGLTGFVTTIGAMRTAAAGASGGLGRLSAAFGVLSRSAKIGLVGAGIGLLVVALTKLASLGKAAPPDVDKLTTSLGNLAVTGKAGGEAARLFGKDLGGLYDAVRNITDPSTTDKIQQGLVKVFSLGLADSTPHTEAKEKIDAIDEGLTNLVRGGKARLAAQALEDLSQKYAKGGHNADDFRKKLDGYKAALEDQAFEQRLVAESMGLFGTAAQAAQQKLDAQKVSADGLRQSIMALNDTSRSAFDAQTRFEESLDNVAKSIKENGQTLDKGTEKGRANRDALSQLAAATEDAAAKARENGSSWNTVLGIYDKGRKSLIDNAYAITHNREEAKRLADQLLTIPADKTTRLKANVEDLEAKIRDAKAKLAKVPDSRQAKIRADITDLLRKLAMARAAANGLHDKRVVYTAEYRVVRTGGAGSATAYSRSGGHQFEANGGLLRRASGGPVHHYDEGGYIQGPGGPMSDSILASFGSGAMARVSNTEYVVQASAVKKYGVRLLDALNAGRLKLAGFARGGLTQGEKDARGQLRGNLGVSYFGRVAGYSRTPFEKSLSTPQDLGSLVASLNEVAGQIRAGFRGRQESSLLRQLTSVGKGLINYDKQLYKVTASLDKAKSKLDDLKNSASQLSDSVRSGVLSSANITRGASGGGPVTVASIMGGLTASRDKATAFAGALSGLRSKGLDKSLIQQIAESGIEGGGLETAGALLGASSSEIRSLNSLQSQIAKAASSAGATTADAVYGASIRAQEKLVNSLKSQQARLEKAMDRLTKTMEKALARAVGKKASGGIVGAAASGGVRGGLTWVGEHEPELLDIPVGSRVWSGPDSRRKAAAMAGGGGSSRPIVLNVSFGTREFGQLWIDVGRGEVRARGGLKAALGGLG